MKPLCFTIAMILASAAGAEDAPLRLVQSIPLPDGRGRIDHLALDRSRQRLFVAELGNDSVAVVDLAAGKLIGRLSGTVEPQGVVFVPESDRLFVTSGGTGAVAMFEGADLRPAGEVDLGDDADNIRYDPASGEVYVGYGDGALGIVAAPSGERLDDIPLAAHPESFQLESAGPRIFVNVPRAGHVAVVDRAKRTPVADWPLADVRANFPMALDEAGHRLIVVTREPPTLLVIDTDSGKEIARVDSCGDADDVFYDARRSQLYVSCGQGFLEVVALGDPAPRRLASIPTAAGARTSLFVPDDDRLYVAAPRRDEQSAEVLVYQPTS
jgi:DNA-binding beta-propeller fold protein YncE